MSAKILIEAYNLTLARGTGIATYARNLSQAARKLGYRTQALIGLDTKIDRRDPLLGEIQRFDARKKQNWRTWLALSKDFIFGSPFGVSPFRLTSKGVVIQPAASPFEAFDETFAAPFLFQRANLHFQRWGRFLDIKPPEKPNLFHVTHPTPVQVRGCANIVTVHDLVPLRLPYATLDNKKYHLDLLRAICQKADHIVTVSEFSRREIISFLGVPEDRITNTYQAVSVPEKLARRSEDEIAATLRNGFELEPQGYFLFFGALEPKKNVGRLVEAYAASGVKPPLLIVGGLGWQHEADMELINDERFTEYAIEGERIYKRKRVRRIPHVPFQHLISLIQGARAVIFPSIYEGFGLPVLEAMLLGTPVITSNVSSLPEIAGDAALLVDPTDTDALSDAIRSIDADTDLRAEFSQLGRERAKFFAPEKYGERLDLLYRSVLKSSVRSASS